MLGVGVGVLGLGVGVLGVGVLGVGPRAAPRRPPLNERSAMLDAHRGVPSPAALSRRQLRGVRWLVSPADNGFRVDVWWTSRIDNQRTLGK